MPVSVPGSICSTDQAKPLNLLQGIRRTLKPDGVYLAQDIHSSSHHHHDREHPLGTLLYTISIMHCMSVSLAQGGEGLGAKALAHALRHAWQIACNPDGITALGTVLDVLDQEALAFYRSFSFFLPLTDNPMKLFVPMASLETL